MKTPSQHLAKLLKKFLEQCRAGWDGKQLENSPLRPVGSRNNAAGLWKASVRKACFINPPIGFTSAICSCLPVRSRGKGTSEDTCSSIPYTAHPGLIHVHSSGSPAIVASPAIYSIKLAYCHPALQVNHPFTVTISSAAHENSPLLAQYWKEQGYCRCPLLLARADKVQNRKGRAVRFRGVSSRQRKPEQAVLKAEQLWKICCLRVSGRAARVLGAKLRRGVSHMSILAGSSQA